MFRIIALGSFLAMPAPRATALLAMLAWVFAAPAAVARVDAAKNPRQDSPTGACFELYEAGVGEIRRDPANVCRTRVTPASTFKIPHALIALDSGAIAGPGEVMNYTGGDNAPYSARRAHTLGSAIQFSVVWYFQKIAKRVGAAKEAAYLEKLNYGNRDSSSGLTTFWLGGSLQVTPDEQMRFLQDFFEGRLPIKAEAVSQVQHLLLQPPGTVVNSLGRHTFLAPWPLGTTVEAKTGGATDADGRKVRWLVGRVNTRGKHYYFVSCVIGGAGLDDNAGIDLAAKGLREAGVL